MLNTIEANTLTENLLTQSQSQAQELQSQQEELRESNEDLGARRALLAEQNIEVERKNQEVELAKRLVEEKAEQLAISSKYKSEFLANMSHELRTPLNSLLILAEQFEDNPDRTMTVKQVEYASMIRSSGFDLLDAPQRHPRPRQSRVGNGPLEMSAVSSTKFGRAERDFAHVAESEELSLLDRRRGRRPGSHRRPIRNVCVKS